MIDWFVLLTPLLLLPIFLLFAFIGCADILGIEEGVPREPAPDPAEVTFTYEGNLQVPQGYTAITRVAWFFSEALEYPPEEDFPLGFNLGIHERLDHGGQIGPNPLLPGGETVPHGQIGNPDGGSMTCECRIFVDDVVAAISIQEVERVPGDTDFAHFTLQQDLTLV
jgi:hypothetical protein